MKTRSFDKLAMIIAAASAFLASPSAGKAQSLQMYYNFTIQGTVSGGGSVTDTMGNGTATLNNDPDSTLTSSGLTISSGANSLTSGVVVSSNSMSGFTGSFTLQDWVTLSQVNGNQVLFGANNGDTNTYVGDSTGPGNENTTLMGGIRYGSNGTCVSGFIGGDGPSGNAYSRYGYGIADGAPAASAAVLYDDILTFDANTNTFTEYLNGTEVGSEVTSNWGSLAQAASFDSYTGKGGFSIGGGMNEPFTDASDPETTQDFLFYNGALTASQVAAVDASGVGASVSTINSDIGAVPEPSTYGLMIGCLGALAVWQRKRQHR